MILVAAVVVLVLGVVAQLLVDPPEVSGWLRYAFGMAFGHMAIWIAAILGLPAAIGLWSMAGANEPDAIPALSPLLRRVIVATVAIALIGVAAFVLLGGRGVTLFDVGFLGLCALLVLGLAGAAVHAPRRGRALLSAAVMILGLAGIGWFVARVLGSPSS